jgi:hypothetical protein
MLERNSSGSASHHVKRDLFKHKTPPFNGFVPESLVRRTLIWVITLEQLNIQPSGQGDTCSASEFPIGGKARERHKAHEPV